MLNEINQILEDVSSIYTPSKLKIDLYYPKYLFGDLATNIALVLAKLLNRPSRQLAQELLEILKERLGDQIDDISLAGPGFINLKFSNNYLLTHLDFHQPNNLKDEIILVEYSDLNAFKNVHIGHLYTTVYGDCLSNVLSLAQAQVYRLNYGGDIGLHVAKSIYSIIQEFNGEYSNKMADIDPEIRSQWLSDQYIQGSKLYLEDDLAKSEIDQLNKRLFKVISDNDHDSELAKIYWLGREWSYQGFNKFYDQINTHFDKYYYETDTAKIGLEIVENNIQNNIFKLSQGAIIFEGEKYNLHTRVFVINTVFDVAEVIQVFGFFHKMN